MLLRPRFPRLLDLRSPSSPAARATLLFLALYLVAFLYLRRRCDHDPSSAFFAPYRAHTPRYSAVRKHEAAHFILDAERSAPFALPFANRSAAELEAADAPGPELCVGIATVARKGARYFRHAVGSVLDGLDDEERKRLHLLLFIAQTDPAMHPAAGEKWIDNVADTVVRGYDGVEGEELDRIKGWEREQGLFRQKGLFDYAYLLEQCDKTGARYTVVLEDDVVAMKGWLPRVEEALKAAEAKTHEWGEESFLYLRLFYTEQFLGYNSEEWPGYLFLSLLTIISLTGVLHILRRRSPTLATTILTTPVLYLTALVFLPLSIGLFFAAGRSCLAPLAPGIHHMPRYGCCSQGFAFQARRVRELVTFYRGAGVGFVDMLTEEFADSRGELRWAMSPPVLQHVGARSSKADGGSLSREFSAAESIWSYGFEDFSPERLEEEKIARAHGVRVGWGF
ncbi:uncharacterized protein K452DRAFT_239276 [Aplosporella prunicola CBS 121167]|uniref:Uncharacterized protein n=1 Tax=Aplosporella prunicola CBS 121167 TaxID=1176127 RepID=A0A6A6AWD3_9PEZI|nr:uncharacterized protein K452DRAFT_239276 [Aplosporella prunicola CBS 121167]KAF2135493.1 hypothetical protein K452DRAFT_239276 [Aplosporella prunicola CBS 121167]